MAALMVATAAKPGFGSRAALPEISTTAPFEAFRASQARIVSRRAPCSFSAMPSSHCASVISNKSICGTAPAMFTRASILPKRSSVPWTRVSAEQGCAQIERVSQGFGARGFYLGRGLLELVLLPRGQDNGFEIACQAYRGSAADALARASDDGNGLLARAASPVPLLESRPPLHPAPYTSDCGLRGVSESSRPSAPPYSAASPAQSCDPLPLTETTMASFSTPAQEPSLECISPRSAAARLRESWSGPVKPCERLRVQNPLPASRSARAHPARDAAPPDAAWRDKKHPQPSHPQRAPAPPRTPATLPGHPSRPRSRRPHMRVPPAIPARGFSQSRVGERLCRP